MKYTTCPCCGQLGGKNSCRSGYAEVVDGLSRVIEKLRGVVDREPNQLLSVGLGLLEKARILWVIYGSTDNPSGKGQIGGKFNAFEPEGARA